MTPSLLAALAQKGFLNPTPITESTNHLVYSSGETILKIDTNPQKLAKEYQILQSLHPKVRCPKALFFEEIAGHFVLGLQKLPGKPLSYIRSTLSQPQKDALLIGILHQVDRIHSHILPDLTTYDDYLEQRRRTGLAGAQQNPHLWPRAPIIAAYQSLPKISPDPFVLIHNDLRYKNILVTPDGHLSGIIDFEEAFLAPAYIEYFRITDHHFFARNYIEKWAQDYTEVDFLTALLKKLETNSILPGPDSPERLLYSLVTYVRLASQFEKPRYDHTETERYQKLYLKNFL